MTMLRSRVTAWLGRAYLARAQKKGLDLAKMRLIPNAALVPLRRNGLDPIAELGRRRSTAPISKLPLPLPGRSVWLVTGHPEAKTVLGRTSGLSNDFTNLIGTAGVQADENPGGLGFADPPVHTRLRKVLTPEFTMRRLARLTPRIDAIIAEQLDAMAAAEGPVDLWTSFALPIPSLTICELLGVPYSERAEFQRLSTTRFDLFGGAGASLGAMTESLGYLRETVARQRKSPGDGLLGMLIREHGDEIDDEELAGLADGVLTGGLETTASMLALGALLLMENPAAREQVTTGAEPVNRFVEEILRYLTVVQVAFPRFATEDMEIEGVQVSTGDILLVSLSAANRDPGLGDDDTDMETFDPTRKASSHLAFGYGFHRCIGAELARMELRAAYPALISRFPQIRLAVGADELSYRQTSIVYGVDALPVTLA
ncbi:MAG TPA: cytochrome P450 [Pseudonocardiaceae bacterium]|nr:cytochrome P450 [Pseudonocardiaceae bacterium]